MWLRGVVDGVWIGGASCGAVGSVVVCVVTLSCFGDLSFLWMWYIA